MQKRTNRIVYVTMGLFAIFALVFWFETAQATIVVESGTTYETTSEVDVFWDWTPSGMADNESSESNTWVSTGTPVVFDHWRIMMRVIGDDSEGQLQYTVQFWGQHIYDEPTDPTDYPPAYQLLMDTNFWADAS